MRHSWRVYIVAAVVLVLSALAAWTLPTTDILRGLAGIPGAFALIAALYQILRDQAAHERQLDLQERRQLFSLGTASHMANVTFDKHVAFSEAYISRVEQGLTELFARGPTKGTLTFGGDLAQIRVSYRAWIPKELEAKIAPFEDALRRIGAMNIALEALPPGDKRGKLVNEMYEIFADVLQVPREGQVDEKVASREIIGHLQELLGVQHLLRLRTAAIQAAIIALEKTAQS